MNPPTHFHRPTVCTIDLGAMERNVAALRRLAGDRKFIAVVKSNAYGHGAVEIARTLEHLGVDRLAVVALEEAVELREAGIRTPILILGILQPSSAHIIATYRFASAVFSQEMAGALQAAVRRDAGRTFNIFGGQEVRNSAESAAQGPHHDSTRRPRSPAEGAAQSLGIQLPVHIKIDSGMGRLGIKPSECPSMAATLRECPNLHVEGVFTHLAKADTDPEFTAFQLKQFGEASEVLKDPAAEPPIRHAANSAALLRFPEALFDAVRPGLALYGISPLEQAGNTVPLEPILSLSTRVLFLKQVPADTPISYGGTFRTRRPSVIATLPVGYADGLNRLRSNPSEGRGGGTGGSVLVRGKRAPIVGRITMDLTMIDVTEIPGVAVDDEVVLIGSQGTESISAAEWATQVGSIPYEVLCGISIRVPRIYVESQTTHGPYGETARRPRSGATGGARPIA